MIEEQRKGIFKLRSQGLGYIKTIARELRLSSDTVKGYCKRHHLNGPGEVVKLNVQVGETVRIFV
jgi:orotate phosphoribosyltransferase-like protein